ncbi:MAG: hypothetical protein WCJ30_22595, partial [Deltaproteobacteria bacterium]
MAGFDRGQIAEAMEALDQAVRDHPENHDWLAFADQLVGVVDGACKAFARGTDQGTADTLRQTRFDLVSALNTPRAGSLAAPWKLYLGRMHALVHDSGIRDFVRTADEDLLLGEILRDLLAAPDGTRPPGPFLAAMLLARSFEIPLVDDVERVPDWMRDRYFAFLLQTPGVFNVVGEAERHVDHLERVTALVHRTWVATPRANENPVSRDLAAQYVAHAGLGLAYFSPRNLRSLYAQRGEILSATLVAGGMQTLEAFAPVVSRESGRIKLGIFALHFGPQTETYFTLSHFDHIDRARFDITLYAMGTSRHPLERYCISRADRIVVLPAKNFAAQARRIRDDDLDVLLLSTNMTAVTNAAFVLGSMRLARIQVASVSSPVTTGARHVDVLLSAAWNEPDADAAEDYTEHLELMEGSVNYYAYQYDKDPPTVDVSRESLGIPV